MTDQTESPAATLAAATQEGVLPNERLTLLSTMHGPDSARALLRIGGRVVTVASGDRIDGATVAAIGDGVLILARGRSPAFMMPNEKAAPGCPGAA
ncbi:MAG: hypothetical protein ACU0AX_14100 [Roseovarius sp.]|uniref:hypothetical protein n=1 Tax=Roseovarius sp. TaxID=1486281 RepID=UPI00405977AC